MTTDNRYTTFSLHTHPLPTARILASNKTAHITTTNELPRAHAITYQTISPPTPSACLHHHQPHRPHNQPGLAFSHHTTTGIMSKQHAVVQDRPTPTETPGVPQPAPPGHTETAPATPRVQGRYISLWDKHICQQAQADANRATVKADYAWDALLRHDHLYAIAIQRYHLLHGAFQNFNRLLHDDYILLDQLAQSARRSADTEEAHATRRPVGTNLSGNPL
jgi:hypothetical protein